MQFLEEIDYLQPGFAGFYDDLPVWSAPFAQMLLEHVPLLSCGTILDVGTGTGFSTLELAQRCGSDVTVIAVDPWEEAMDHLARKVQFLQIENARLLVEDVVHMSVPENSIDLIVSNLGINNFSDQVGAFKACHRVAKEECRIIFTSNLVGHMEEFYTVFRSTLVETGQEDCIAALEKDIHHRATIESVTDLLHETGFELTDVIQDQFQLRYVDGTALLNHSFFRIGFLAAWKSIVPSDRVLETFRALEAKLNQYARQQGELAMTIPMACFKAKKR